jgi:CheY-like chemotaxis protein
LPYHCATDGLQAVEAFSQHQSLSAAGKGAAIQLILMDLQMPVCDGIEATRQIRLLEKQNKWRECVIFIITGQDSPTDREIAQGAGADDYFVKPVGIKVLDRVVKRHFPVFEGG